MFASVYFFNSYASMASCTYPSRYSGCVEMADCQYAYSCSIASYVIRDGSAVWVEAPNTLEEFCASSLFASENSGDISVMNFFSTGVFMCDAVGSTERWIPRRGAIRNPFMNTSTISASHSVIFFATTNVVVNVEKSR